MAKVLPEDSWTRVGQTIRTMRELRGLTVDQLARGVLKSRPYVANIEAGRKPLTPPMLVAIAGVLGVKTGAILRPDLFQDAA